MSYMPNDINKNLMFSESLKQSIKAIADYAKDNFYTRIKFHFTTTESTKKFFYKVDQKILELESENRQATIRCNSKMFKIHQSEEVFKKNFKISVEEDVQDNCIEIFYSPKK